MRVTALRGELLVLTRRLEDVAATVHPALLEPPDGGVLAVDVVAGDQDGRTAVGQLVRTLEEWLGTPLFHRRISGQASTD